VDQEKANQDAAAAAVLESAAATPAHGKIDKSPLAIAEPKRLRDKAHLKLHHSLAYSVGGSHPILIIFDLRNREQLDSK
jgi:hypothetical protein